MEFGVVNFSNACILVMMLIPNVIYALRGGEGNKTDSRFLALTEQLGRYGAMVLMVFPVGVREFGFPNVLSLFAYVLGNCVLLLAYLVIWVLYFRRKTKALAMVLAVIPVCIFMLCGVCLHHWLLVLFSTLFAVGHILITRQSASQIN